MSPQGIWEINFPGKENNQCQAPEKEEFQRNKDMTQLAGVQ